LFSTLLLWHAILAEQHLLAVDHVEAFVGKALDLVLRNLGDRQRKGEW